MIADTPKPPYYAVIFTSLRNEKDVGGYAEAAARMLERARRQPGFLGFESARDGLGISVSYWRSLEDIAAWKRDAEHRRTQRQASHWYDAYRIRICRVEREYGD